MPPAPFSEGRSNGLHFRRYGSGRPIVALHGFGATSYTWRHMLAPLSAAHDVWTVDLRGHGKSERPAAAHYALKDYADQVFECIVQNDLKDLTLIGHSMGGGVALLVAMRLLREGRRLHSLILINSISYPQTIPFFMRLLRTPLIGILILRLIPAKLIMRAGLKASYYDASKITEDAVREYATNLRDKAGRNMLVQTARQIIPDDIDSLTREYKDINVPTLILWGREDALVPLSHAERLARDIPDSRLEIVDSCAHIPQEEMPAIAVGHITTFLSNIERS